MLRALLALSADIPQEAALRLDGIEAGNPPGPNARQCLGYGVPDLARALASDDNRAILLADRQELDLDQVALYAVPIPDAFRATKGQRTIRVSLAFDPPVRHTRIEYLAARMSFKLLRGLSHAQVLDHFKRRDDRTPIPEVPSAAFCDLDPGIQARGSSTLQCATFTQKVSADRYGDVFYVAVFTERRWAGDDITRQRYALAVELRHDACGTLYQRCTELNVELTQRLRLDA